MENLIEFVHSTDEGMEKKEELEEKADSIDGHMRMVIEERDHYIMEKLNKLEGDSAQKVKENLDTQAQKKQSMLNETHKEIHETEEMLANQLQILDARIEERNDALSKIEELGREADIDVSESTSDVNNEITEMNGQRDKIVGKLRVRARSTGNPIVI